MAPLGRVYGARWALDVSLALALAILTVWIYRGHLADPIVYEGRMWLGSRSWLWTDQTWWLHSTALGVHLVNGLLLAVLLQQWGASRSLAILGMALLWVHPLAVEAVAYDNGRRELLLTTTLLLAAVGVSSRHRIGDVVAVGLSVLAVFIKPNGLETGAVVLLLWWLQGRRMWAVCLGGVGLSLVLPRIHAVLTTPTTVWDQATSWGLWWRWEALGVWRLASLWIWPAHLSVDPDLVHVGVLPGVCAALSLLILGLLTIHALWRDQPPTLALVALGWCLVVLLPRFALRVPLSVLNEHHGYALLPAWSMLTVQTAARWGLV